MVLGRFKLIPEGVELRPWRCLEVRGRPEVQNGGLTALEEAWDDFLRSIFLSSLLVFCGSGSSQAGSRRSGAASLEVLGGQGK